MTSKADKKLIENMLVRKRVCVVRDVIEKFKEGYNADRDANQIQVRLDTLERCNREFLEAQAEIEMLDKADAFEQHLQIRADFENRFCALKGFLMSKLEVPQQILNSTMASFSHQPTSVSFHHRLPKIDLPKFNGDESRWISFRDNFLSMIHFNDDIPLVNKLQYLIQALEGDAKKPFETVDIQADNYASTWDALLKRFDNKRFLKKELFRGLYELPSIRRESAQDLNTLVDDYQRHVKALGKLGEPVASWNTPLVYILTSKLDPATVRAWEQETRQKDDVTYEELVDFLVQHVRMLKSVSSDLQHRSQPATVKVAGFVPKKPYHGKFVANAATSDTKVNNPQCPACPERHLLYQCPRFTKLSVSERRELVSQRSLCWNCFRTNHQARACKSKFSCRTCHAKHHSLLHDQVAPSKISTTPAVTTEHNAKQPTATTSANVRSSESANPPEISLSIQSNHSTVLLETVAIHVVDKYGKLTPVRALLDSGSMSNFITKKLANALAIRPRTVDVAVAGIGDSVKQIKRQISATIKSRTNKFSTTLEFLVMKKPTANLPTIPLSTTSWKIPKIQLADPYFNEPGLIDIIIGGECYHEIHTGKRIPIGSGLPLLIETVFGWTVSGKVPIKSTYAPPTCYISNVDRSLDTALQRFWELESVHQGPLYSAEERRCEEIYASTTTRTQSGRFIVRLPRSEDPQVTLGDSRAIAIRRFYSLERRLERDATVRTAYLKFMEEYASLHHMRKIDPVPDNKPHCYLPHHPVFKESSTTTKVRVVFDASCKTSSGFSLNNTLLVGPVVQQDLLSIVIRFRFHAVALVADIEKMYRQIEVHPDDQPLQRILWRASPSDPLATYELCTVTYGTASAPFLATRTLQYLAQVEGHAYPAAADAVNNDFYVDDLLTGADDPQAAIAIRQQVAAMLKTAGFVIKKWASNVPEVLTDVPVTDLAIQPLHDLQNDQSISTLGLVWDIKCDMFRFNVQLPLPAAVLTKRKVKSYIAKIFDPLGLVGPIIAAAKMFMQRLWRLKTEDKKPYVWDRPLPPRSQDTWRQFHATLHVLDQLRIPRFVAVPMASNIEFHIFCDASESAYGACCFVRSENSEGVNVQLLTSKSKVAPISTKHTIARLELCAAELAAKVYQKVTQAIKISTNTTFWSDSTTVLQWLRSPPNRWRTFVANRVSFIQTSTEGTNWRHVPGVENPADELSRGLQPTEILTQTRWWNGPVWLALPPSSWPHSVVPNQETIYVEEETRTVALISTTLVESQFADHLFARYSSYTKLRHVMGYCLKFIRLAQKKTPKVYPNASRMLSTIDLKAADHALARLAQAQLYPDELALLNCSTRCEKDLKSSPLKWLKPFMCENGLIRVGGRLSNSDLPEGTKHPIVVSANHPLVEIIVTYYHKLLLHAGPQLMLSTIRQKYWIIGARNLVRRVYHRCIKCFRQKPILIQQATADLPKSRVSPSRPFSVSGVDYCGPVYLKSAVRRHGPVKAYIAIFVCFATKAVHIELVSDLSTPAFLSALRRFIARRGRIRELHSDNGTAFKGAANHLRHVFEMLKSNGTERDRIVAWCVDNEIEWKFSPPRAPHFGGLWEAAVKSAKYHLLREIGHTSISQEDMITLLAQIEMCLNSRPLTPIPGEPTDLEVLTPGHFLVGSNMQAVPEPSLIHTSESHLNHWQRTQKIFQRIWARWYPEYLAQLQSRATKGCKRPVPIERGRIVVIKDDNLPPATWPLGKIVKLHPGKDGVTRVVTIKTAVAENVVRPIARIAILPLPTDAEAIDEC
ncbi:uncharacterized protein LOC129716899 [Wyeomyia smithii]|uniref:uncharacterized protein LOC129716899 n=1 Tax=Wyeomyia smithii TaxID=174621 RepID=UPI00246811DB|nr:uncharacterized protein LOC129716899 [Wyeomyia smithii]